MIPAPIPANEAERLAALGELHILDSDFEPAYDAIANLAAAICCVPSATITLIDRDRQWHKAMFNVEDREAPRAITFCAHTILGTDSLIVEDASLPASLEVVARASDDPEEIHAVRHREHPVWGVQFHPESIMTSGGLRILQNFLALAG